MKISREISKRAKLVRLYNIFYNMRSSVVRNYEINECVMVNIILGRFIHSFMALLGVPMNWIGVLDNIKSAHNFFWPYAQCIKSGEVVCACANEAVHKKAWYIKIKNFAVLYCLLITLHLCAHLLISKFSKFYSGYK